MKNLDKILEAELQEFEDKINNSKLPELLKEKAKKELVGLQRSVELGNYDTKYEKVSRYIDWILQIPWDHKTQDNLDIQRAKEIFNKHHYGLEKIKDRFLEYISIMKLRKDNPETSKLTSTVLLLVGLVGTGKTTFAFSLAEALDREIIRIAFGGLNDPATIRGESRLILGSEPGRLVRGLCEKKTVNPVILLDEIDRVAEETRMDIMGVLVELLDPAQNSKFYDNYIDYPIDLSEAIFIATANNTTNIVTAVMDRMEKIKMPSYTDEQKIKIAQDYLLPDILQASGLKEGQFVIDDNLWPQIVRPLGFDAGIRSLKRNLESAVRKAARIIVERDFDKVYVTQENKKIFLPRY